MKPKTALALRVQEPVRQGPVRRIQRGGASVTGPVNGDCKFCRVPTKNRIGIPVVVGTVWVRACKKCIKRFKLGAEFIKKLSEIGDSTNE